MAITSAALKSELQNDPTGIGLAEAVAAGVYQSAATLLNQTRAGITIEKVSVSARDLIASLAPTEYIALTQPQRDYLALLPALIEVDIRTGSPLRNALNLVFASGSATRTAYVALASRTASRAEQLGGPGTVVTANDVDRALNG